MIEDSDDDTIYQVPGSWPEGLKSGSIMVTVAYRSTDYEVKWQIPVHIIVAVSWGENRIGYVWRWGKDN